MGDLAVIFQAIFMQVAEGFIGYVEGLPGANTQGATLDEVKENLREAVTLVLEATRELAESSGSTNGSITNLSGDSTFVVHLEKQGCRLLGIRGLHYIYVNPKNNQIVAVPQGMDIDRFLVRRICEVLGVDQP